MVLYIRTYCVGPSLVFPVVMLGDSGVEIPDSFYKIIIDEKDNRPRILAFIIPQGVLSSESLDKFLTNVDEIEKLTELDFMSELEDEMEDKIEAGKAEGMW